MINSNELRVNNLISFKGKTIKLLYGADIDASKQYDPIPLTEEWLTEKFGFTFNNFDLNRFDDPNEGGNRYHIIPYKSNYVFRCAGCSLVEIKSVHQLQNLYYNLKAYELTIK